LPAFQVQKLLDSRRSLGLLLPDDEVEFSRAGGL
jgi:hypothetical protein